MKLRRSFSSHQLFFALGITVSCLFWATVAQAQDKIINKNNQVQEGKILSVSGSSVMVQIGSAGSMGLPLSNIKSVVMAAPPEVAAANAAFAAGDNAKALAQAKAVVDKFKGLPVDWAQQTTGLLGDIYVALEKLPEAEAAYRDFQKLYGGQGGSLQSDVGLARIALSKKDYAAAKEKLEPITTKALEEKSPSPQAGVAYSQAFYLLGQVQEAQGEYVPALENYLRTVTLFYHDTASVSAAQEKADALRKAHQITVP